MKRALAALILLVMTTSVHAMPEGGPDSRYIPGRGYVDPGGVVGQLGPFQVRSKKAVQPKQIVKKQKRSAVAKKKPVRTIKGYALHQSKSKGRLSLDGYPAPLVTKVRELERECGSKLISAYRPGARVRGSGKPSLHASKKAVDLVGNPKCMAAHLRNWPGGRSMDYYAVNHYHISYAPNSREWNSQFVHWKPKRTGVGG